ncbi:hypothetical protein HG537_0A06560 [Torulaspora globosa]|uniref:NADPH:adrenodoxin oxidoreductase, mitochondrial n=1 Tax=Torulaspora globosa TaxID=48254 RepID=A0A7H9HM84_9SACH|nr:hypothetical protein HG537_0A06560 [Torulaspora sp. CBS 2947]
MIFQFLRHASTNCRRRRISIVGSGPSGFYTAYRLLTKCEVPLHVTMWEKLPVPFGLSRYGVAPDHPEVKNCEETFTECAEEFCKPGQKHLFEFIGGVTVGEQVTLSELIDKQDAVVLSYGCTGDKKLGIPGENDTTGVFSSREFVNWYNGHPEYANDPRFVNFDWSRVRNVGIIGNGNVALDLTRALISNQIGELWDGTDISPIALRCLRQAPVEHIKLIARRDFDHSKFTNKELRELWELEKYGIHGKIDPQYFREDNYDIGSIKDRAFKRRVEMCSEYLKPFDQRTKKNYKKFPPAPTTSPKTWELDYLKTPIRINSDESGRITSLTLCKNKVTPDNKVCQLKDQQVTYDLDLLITSLGYAGRPLKEFQKLGIQFEKGHLANTAGRVLNSHGATFPGLYASGWIRTGSTGVIASTMMGAFEVADSILQDLSSLPAKQTDRIDFSHINHTTWADWRSINKTELQQGEQAGKTRVKFLTNKEMLNFHNQTSA